MHIQARHFAVAISLEESDRPGGIIFQLFRTTKLQVYIYTY